MENKGKYYITTAIAYASRKPHIGNTYDVVSADVIARYKRATGYDVFFCTGTDEHGQKIENYAADAGISPQEYVDNISSEIKLFSARRTRISSERPTIITSPPFRRYSRSSTSRAIFTKTHTRAGTAFRASRSLQTRRRRAAFAPTAAGRSCAQKRKRTSSK